MDASITMARQSADFCITVDFEKGKGNPSRAFRTMSDLIDAFQKVDETLIQSIHSKIEPVLLLEDVEIGSIKAWLRQALESVDDDAIKELDWKKFIGAYLVRGKKAIINFIDGKTTITSGDLEILESELIDLAAETDVKHLPSYEPISRRALLEDIHRINQSLKPLEAGDKASFTAGGETADFNLTLSLTPETIEELTISETQQHAATMIMKVKKPDFMGDSMWQFHYDNRTLDVKIADVAWLKSYQDGNILIQPGDAIRAQVEIQVEYGHEGDVVSTHYVAVEIVDVIVKPKPRQGRMFSEENTETGITIRRRAIDFNDE